MSGRRLCLGLSGVVVLAVLVSAGVWRLRAAGGRPEYALPPFEPVGEGGPALMIEREFPRTGTAQEKEAWRKEVQAIRRRLTHEGAMKRASAKEREAIVAEDEGQYVKARELAEAVLADEPGSVPARFVLACAQYKGEQNLPRALYEIRQLRYRLEEAGQADPADADAREWYIRVLDVEEEILGYMNRREEQLRALACLEQVYRPVPWMKVFPLIKLGRIDEALEQIARLEKRGGHPLAVLNYRLMVAEHRRDREGMYRAGKEMVTRIPNSPVLWNNFALACQGVFRFNEAEQAFVRAATAANQDFNGSAFFELAQMYLSQSRFQEAWHALHQGQRQRARRAAHTLEQDQATALRSAAQVLLALGYAEAAERFARRALDSPNRMGSTTSTDTEQVYVNGLTLWAALRSRIELRREAAALATGGERLSPDSRRQALALEAWTLERRLVKVLADEQFLVETFRPYLRDQSANGVWFNLLALELLPVGVATEAVRRARQAETHEAAGPYFDGMEARLALRRGDAREALMKAEQALEKLPLMPERLLRAQVAAVGAEAARRLGEKEKSLALSGQALRDFPQAFRLYGLTVPVRIDHDGSDLARRLAAHLRRCCRFRLDPAGFPIHVRCDDKKLAVRMERSAGELHVECDVEVKGGAGEVVEAAFRRFQVRLTSPWLDLTAIEINAVEGARQ